MKILQVLDVTPFSHVLIPGRANAGWWPPSRVQLLVKGKGPVCFFLAENPPGPDFVFPWSPQGAFDCNVGAGAAINSNVTARVGRPSSAPLLWEEGF